MAGTATVLSFRIGPSGKLKGIGAAVLGFPLQPAIAVDPKGRFLYATGVVHTDTGDRFGVLGYAIDSTGVLTPLAGGNLVTDYFGRVQAIAVDPTGRFVYIAESGSIDSCLGRHGIAAFRIQAGGRLTPIGNFLDGCRPNALAVDPTGQFVYMSNRGNNTVSAFRADLNGALTVISAPVDARTEPHSIIVDATGRYVYVAGQFNISGPGEVAAFGIADLLAGSLFPMGLPVKTGNIPGGIGTTSCSAPLPGANFIPRVTTTSLNSPVVTRLSDSTRNS